MKLLPQKLVWYSRRTLEQIGLHGVAGLGLLTFCAIFYLGAIVPIGHEMASLKGATAVKVPTRQSTDQLTPDPTVDRVLRHLPQTTRQIRCAGQAA